MAHVIKQVNSNLAFRDIDVKPIEGFHAALSAIEEDDDLH
jgi:hypothetical protein